MYVDSTLYFGIFYFAHLLDFSMKKSIITVFLKTHEWVIFSYLFAEKVNPMEHWLIGGVIAALVGLAISAVNYKISLAVLKRKPDMVAAVSLPRQILNVGYLLLVYFLSPATPWDRTPLLIGAVIGMTGSMFLFTTMLLKHIPNSKPSNTTEGSGGDNLG